MFYDSTVVTPDRSPRERMMRRIRWTSALVLIGLIASAALVPAAGAVAPVRETIPYENAFTDTESCAFPIEVSFVGEIRVTSFFDRSGELVRVQVQGSDVAAATNPANGKTARGVDRWLEIDNRRTGEYTIVGLYYHLNFPGAGIVLHESGKITFDSEGNVVHLAGPHDVFEGDFSRLCAALA